MKRLLDIFKQQNYLILLFILILPYSVALGNIFFIGCCVFIATNIFINKQRLAIAQPYSIFYILVLYLMINGILQSNYHDNRVLWKFIPIVAIGMLLFLNVKNFPIENAKKISILSCVFFIFICLFRTSIHYFTHNELPFNNSEFVNKILILDRPYLGFYCLLNIILVFDFALHAKGKSKMILLTLSLFLFLFLILIVARLAIISFILLAFIYLLFYSKHSIKLKVSGFFCLLLFFGLFISINPQFKERFIINNSIESFIDYEPRFEIWKAVHNITTYDSYNKLVGIGNYSTIDRTLIDNYSSIENQGKKEFYLSERFNSHSQFFDYLLFGGGIGFLLFVGFHVYGIYIYKDQFTSMALFISFTLFFILENIFYRQFGVYLFIIYLSLAHHQHSLKSIKPNDS